MGTREILILTGGFLAGFILLIVISFIYFFRADKSILRRLLPIISNPKEYITYHEPRSDENNNGKLMQVEWYLNTPLSVHKARDVSHYTQLFIDTVFKRHHFAAVLSVFFAFLF
ncbi:MAG: hypothetical protein HC867_04050 [Bacteroidia bacterium]|nr:hypothetical protein [Bacteroidia bacterium]